MNFLEKILDKTIKMWYTINVIKGAGAPQKGN